MQTAHNTVQTAHNTVHTGNYKVHIGNYKVHKVHAGHFKEHTWVLSAHCTISNSCIAMCWCALPDWIIILYLYHLLVSALSGALADSAGLYVNSFSSICFLPQVNAFGFWTKQNTFFWPTALLSLHILYGILVILKNRCLISFKLDKNIEDKLMQDLNLMTK